MNRRIFINFINEMFGSFARFEKFYSQMSKATFNGIVITEITQSDFFVLFKQGDKNLDINSITPLELLDVIKEITINVNECINTNQRV